MFCTPSSGGAFDHICHLLELPAVLHMCVHKLPVTVVFTTNRRWLYKFLGYDICPCYLSMSQFFVALQISINSSNWNSFLCVLGAYRQAQDITHLAHNTTPQTTATLTGNLTWTYIIA